MPKNALLATSCRYGAFEADTCMFVHQKCNLYIGKCTDMERLGANITNPFFTACGVLSSALCEMLLQSDGENIYLLPAYPAENRIVSFRLAAKGGASVEAEIKNGELKKLKITAKSGKLNFNLYFCGKLIDAKNFRR